MAFPDDLPPAGLDLFTKLVIYFGILYFFTTAITTWLVTRRRRYAPEMKREVPARSSSPLNVGPLSFDDSRDVLSGLKVQIEGAEASLTLLKRTKEQGNISEYAYSELHSQYTTQVSELTEKMNEILKRDITSTTGEVVEGITEDEIDELEADLERQLEDLDKEDSFLRPRPKRELEDVLEKKSKPAQTSPPPPSTQPKARPAAQPQTKAPPPPSSQPKSASPPTKPPAPSAAPPSKVEMPPPPKSQAIPSPTSDQTTTSAPKSNIPAPPPPPKSQQPPAATPVQTNIEAEQPMRVDTDEEGMFAKSTSIAALRMDMLRELARLKKLINEDQE